MTRFGIVALLLLSVAMMSGQEPATSSPQKLYEAGSFAEVISGVASQGEGASPDSIYLAGQSHLRLNQPDEARAQFARLSASGNPWSLIGESATALVGGNTPLAIDRAMQATQIAPDEFHAHYQLGLAYSAAEQWEPAAAAFEQAVAIAPTFAYAHYYAGLAYSKLKRANPMATHLDYFLKLAPSAPERSAVTALMRTVRGR